MRKNRNQSLVRGVACAAIFAATAAEAHIGVSSGPVTANTNNVVTFSVGHGCDGMDTASVTIDIPEAITSARPEYSDLGPPSVTKDAGGLVTSVTWAKNSSDILSEDYAYYQLKVRLRAPNAPFTVVELPIHQTCIGEDGGIIPAEWVADLVVLPAKSPGWNKYTLPAGADIPDLNVFFKDALIVWKDSAAFSANTVMSELIGTTSGVTALTSLTAGDEIWVKY